MKPVTERTKRVQRGCDCDCRNHDAATAPVWLLVERDGKTMRVCSRCDLSSDKPLCRLVSKAMPAQPFMDFDTLGALCMVRYFDTLPVEADYLKSLAKA